MNPPGRRAAHIDRSPLAHGRNSRRCSPRPSGSLRRACCAPNAMRQTARSTSHCSVAAHSTEATAAMHSDASDVSKVSNARSSATAVLDWQPRLAACRQASLSGAVRRDRAEVTASAPSVCVQLAASRTNTCLTINSGAGGGLVCGQPARAIKPNRAARISLRYHHRNLKAQRLGSDGVVTHGVAHGFQLTYCLRTQRQLRRSSPSHRRRPSGGA